MAEFLEFMPAVLIRGARQTGKTTFVEQVMRENGWAYATFDDELVLTEAMRNPEAWLSAMSKPLVIDEIQRFPEIFRVIKKLIDEDRKPGQYLLTGSADPLLLPRLGDSLAGRLGIVDFYPLSSDELSRSKGTFLDSVFSGEFQTHYQTLPEPELYDRILTGGFPIPQTLGKQTQIKQWMNAYLQTMLERDVRDISRVEGLSEFPRLLKLLAIRSGTLLNLSEISRALGMVNVTIKRYTSLLQALFFVSFVPAWYTNLGKRLMKTPKLHVCDTGIITSLLEIDAEKLDRDRDLLGRLLETFVFTEIQKQKSWFERDFQIYHFRDGKHEVDLLLETAAGELIGIEVKCSTKLRSDDLSGLRYLQSITGENFKQGVVLYLGDEVREISQNMVALPIQALWG